MTRGVTGATKSVGPSLTRQAGALASGSLATQASALLLLMALTRLVPKAELGSYQQLGLIYGIMSPLLVAGIPAALLYFVPRAEDPARRRAWVGEAYLLLGSLGLATSIAVAAGRDWHRAGTGQSRPCRRPPCVRAVPLSRFRYGCDADGAGGGGPRWASRSSEWPRRRCGHGRRPRRRRDRAGCDAHGGRARRCSALRDSGLHLRGSPHRRDFVSPRGRHPWSACASALWAPAGPHRPGWEVRIPVRSPRRQPRLHAGALRGLRGRRGGAPAHRHRAAVCERRADPGAGTPLRSGRHPGHGGVVASRRSVAPVWFFSRSSCSSCSPRTRRSISCSVPATHRAPTCSASTCYWCRFGLRPTV